jgi:hypothetical protein
MIRGPLALAMASFDCLDAETKQSSLAQRLYTFSVVIFSGSGFFAQRFSPRMGVERDSRAQKSTAFFTLARLFLPRRHPAKTAPTK